MENSDIVTNSGQSHGIKNDTENYLPIKFQPMPKRFVAWDKYQKKWITKFLMPSTDNEESNDWTCPLTLGIDSKGKKNWLNNDQLIICQSTNLFDKDGKEIFEGSIVDYNGSGEVLGVVVSVNGQWQLKDKNGNLMFLKGAPHQKLVGHILSNPELLEDKWEKEK